MRKRLVVLSTCTVAVALAVVLAAEEPAAKPAADADPEQPLVTVAGKVIKRGEIDEMIARVPHGRKSGMTAQLLNRVISQRLAEAYVENHALRVDEEQFAKQVRQLRTDMALAALFREATSPEKIQAYIAAHPNFFDGTKVRASQILIRSLPSDATIDQLAARKKLEGIAKAIADKKITFAEAATKYSEAASKTKAGDCGAFGFDAPMEMPLKIAGFSTAKGRVSPVIRSGTGWHLVLVTDVKAGDGKPKTLKNPWNQRDTTPESLAKLAIGAEIERGILLSPLADEAKIVYHQKVEDGTSKTAGK